MTDKTFSRRQMLVGAAALGAIGAIRLAPGVGAQSPVASPVPFILLNLNTATPEEFLTIPGLGDRMVHEFEEYRPYETILEFRKEIGKYVDEDQVAQYELYVFVPIDPNKSDKDTLQQLPGVDETIAQKLIDGRPYDSNQAFLDALKKLVSASDFQNADKYLAAAS